jgi:hypothetical protein
MTKMMVGACSEQKTQHCAEFVGYGLLPGIIFRFLIRVLGGLHQLIGVAVEQFPTGTSFITVKRLRYAFRFFSRSFRMAEALVICLEVCVGFCLISE